jgi:hypothetical protein
MATVKIKYKRRYKNKKISIFLYIFFCLDFNDNFISIL